jgi:hypothetical protein
MNSIIPGKQPGLVPERSILFTQESFAQGTDLSSARRSATPYLAAFIQAADKFIAELAQTAESPMDVISKIADLAISAENLPADMRTVTVLAMNELTQEKSVNQLIQQRLPSREPSDLDISRFFTRTLTYLLSARSRDQAAALDLLAYLRSSVSE